MTPFTPPRSLRLAVVLGASALAACSAQRDASQYIGYVEADWVYISSPGSGWIENVAVREGVAVEAGRVLFALDDDRQQAGLSQSGSRLAQAAAQATDLETGARQPEIEALAAQVRETEARLRQAQSEYDRVMPLVAEQIESRLRGDQLEASLLAARAQAESAREQLNAARLAARPANREAARANAEAARADRALARHELDERSIRARRSGTISEIFHQRGEFVTAGSPVIALLPDDGLKVRFFVPQQDLPQFELARKIRISADGLAGIVTARVTFMADEPEFDLPH